MGTCIRPIHQGESNEYQFVQPCIDRLFGAHSDVIRLRCECRAGGNVHAARDGHVHSGAHAYRNCYSNANQNPQANCNTQSGGHPAI